MAVFIIAGTAVLTLLLDAVWTLQDSSTITVATAYAQEGLEGARQIAGRSWTALTLGEHGLTVETVGAEKRYAFAASSDSQGALSRVVSVTEVYRDVGGMVVEQGGTFDPDTRRVTSTVRWTTDFTRRPQEVVLTTLLTNWQSFSWTETLQSQFRQGTLVNTEVIAAPEPPADNGSVRLAGAVDWSAPVVRGTLDIPGNGDARALSARRGYAYLVTDDGATGRLLVINVSDVTLPQLTGSVSLPAPAYDIALYGGYAYVALGQGTGELGVVDIQSAAAPSLVRTLDLADSAGGRSVTVDGSMLLIGREGSGAADELFAYSLTTPSSPTAISSLNIAGDPTVHSLVSASGTSLLATSGDDAEVLAVNFSSPQSPSVLGTLNLPGTFDATGVDVSGARAYVSRSGGQEVSVVDLTNLSALTELGNIDTGNGANDIQVEGGFSFVATRTQGLEFQRIDSGNPSALTIAGVVALEAEPNGVVFSGNYAYLATSGNSRELVIVGGGEGGWANPALLGSVNLSGVKPLLAVAVGGDYAFVGREKTEGTGEFLAINVAEPRAPALVGQLEANATVRSIELSGGRAFAATERDTKELLIVDVSRPASPAELGSFDAPGNADGLDVSLMGNLVALAIRGNPSGPELSLLNVSDAGAPALVGSVNIAGDRDVLAVTGTPQTLFVATADPVQDIQAYDIRVPGAPQFLGFYDLPGTGNPTSLVLRGTNLFVGTRNSGGSIPEFFILDTSTPSSLRLVSTGSALEIGADVFGLDVSGQVALVAADASGPAFQTINVTDLGTPSIMGTRDIGANVSAVAFAGTFSYLATSHTDAEFQILKSSDASGFATEGSYESIAFDSGADSTIWQELSWNAVLNNGVLRLQLRRGDTLAALEQAEFVGPDGTSATYFEASGAPLTLPNSLDPLTGRWIQWRAYVNGTSFATPELQDVTITFRR